MNTAYTDHPTWSVRAFTAAQIPGIAERRYPPVLAVELNRFLAPSSR